MTEKTRREKEEQFFAEMELNKRKALREKLNQEKQVQKKEHAKSTHWMKCPKCGHDLAEKNYEDVQIDVCSECNGVWLDAGELELLLEGRKAKGFISQFLSSMTPKE